MASLFVADRVLAIRVARTPSTFELTKGIRRSTWGGQPFSQRHHRERPLINSSEPTNALIHNLASGSLAINARRSLSSKSRYPPSLGMEPKLIAGLSLHKGCRRVGKTTLAAFTR